MRKRTSIGYLPANTKLVTLDLCPWCGSALVFKVAHRADGLPVMRCPDCQLGFLGELPADLSVFYDQEYFTRNKAPGPDGAETGYEDYDRSYGPSSFRWLSMLVRATVGSDKRRLFDLGAATGTFMEAARLEGFAVSGSELHEGAASAACDKGLHVISGPFDPNDWTQKSFDVVTALEVLEHVRDVRGTLLDLAALLAPDGWLVFFVPILTDAALMQHGDRTVDLLAHFEHILYFNPDFLVQMSEELFGSGRLAMWVPEVEEHGQVITYALGFLKPSGVITQRERRLLDLLASGELKGIDALTTYEVVSIALATSKMGDFNRADSALMVAELRGDQEPVTRVARAQLLRNRGEFHSALAILEDVIKKDPLGRDHSATTLLVDIIEDLFLVLDGRRTGLAEGLAEIHKRVEEARSLNAELDALRVRSEHQREEIDALQRQIEEAESTATRTWDAMEGLGRELSQERMAITELQNKVAHLESDKSQLQNTLNDIYGSRSWRAISKLRAAATFPARLVRSIERARDAEGIDAPFESPATGPSKTDRVWTPQLWIPPSEETQFLVSVIMPVYNKGSVIRSALDSVRAQTLTPVEIILWDDGSSDPETLEVLLEVRRQPGVTLFHAANQGVVSTRNSAVSMSRGKYVCCLDPDDRIAPTYLEQAVALLETHPEFAIAYPWVDTVGARDEFWRTEDLHPRHITQGNQVPICAVFRREVFEKTGGFSLEMTHGYEDWEFWVHAAELGFRGKSIPAPLFEYHYSADSSSSRDARARERHQALKDEIMRLHPRLAFTGVPLYRPTSSIVSPVGRELGPRRIEAGNGRPVVVMIPWMTVGGADRVIRMLIRNWVTQKRTVVVFMTSRLEPGMVDKSRDLRLLTPYVYNLWDFLPIKQWYDFVAATIGALDSPVMFNMGSAWFFDSARALRRHFPHLRIVDQQFNSVGHLSWNRDLADVIDLTIAAYDGLARDLTKNGRKSDVVPVYIGMEEIPIPHQDQSLEFRNHVGVEEGASLILFVGRLSKEKRPEWITRLSSSLRRGEARVVMVGDGPLREEIAEAAKPEEGLVWIPDLEDIEPALAAADLVVLPSRIEGIPLIALEALSLGTPIVATRVGGLPDLEDEEGVTLTDPDDFDAFVEAVRESLRTDFGRIELSERFSSEQMLDHYDKLLFEGE